MTHVDVQANLPKRLKFTGEVFLLSKVIKGNIEVNYRTTRFKFYMQSLLKHFTFVIFFVYFNFEEMMQHVLALLLEILL